jgi:hypothetical protein
MGDSPETKPGEPVAAPVDYCSNCFYFLSSSTTDMDHGICRRNPPQGVNAAMTPTSGDYFKPYWPEVLGNEWCGEHKKLITT